MKISVNKELFLEKLGLASKFTSSRLSSLTVVQGVLIEGEKGKINFYSTDLSSYCHTFIKTTNGQNFRIIVDPKKIIEFLTLLPAGNLEVDISEKQLTISYEKTKGVFPIIASNEFPLPPKMDEKGQKIKADFLIKNLPLILFSSSNDETRPVLTGVNFLTDDDEMVMVATDGFRLSLVRMKKETDIPPMIVPAGFLGEVSRFFKDEEVYFNYSKTEKAISFKIGDNEFFSRLVEGEYPPFEKVIPSEKKTTIALDKEEFLRNIKLISVFARDFSNIIIIETEKDGIQIKPKKDTEGEDVAFQEATVEGEAQRIAFNYKFLLDFLNHAEAKRIKIDLVRSDAPVVFKLEDNPNFLHIIMPVRIQE